MSKSAPMVLAAVSVLVLTACTGPVEGGGGMTTGGRAITVGTTDKVATLDPAGAYDNGSYTVMNQIYPFLMNLKPGGTEPELDIAASASFTTPTEYTVKLKKSLKWANGDTLDSADVKFSFERQLKIKDPNGPTPLLANLGSIEAPDPLTVVFHLKSPNDQTFPQVLASPAGPIVDKDVFPADQVLSDDQIVAKKAFGGQYVITSYQKNQLVSFKENPEYQGLLGKPAADTVNLRYYSDANNLKLEIQQGVIDVAWRSLSATDLDSLSRDDKLKVLKGPGGEIRYLVFNFDTMPFGAETPEADPKKALAVRSAVADLVDREALGRQVYKGLYSPLYSVIPQAFPGATTPLKTLYGNGAGGPSPEKAKKALADVGITAPVTLKLQYNPDHYGSSSGDEYALVKQQLEATGLFQVELQSTEWVSYAKARTQDAYPVYQLGWFPAFSDEDNYLTPFFSASSFLKNHYSNPGVEKLVAQEARETDKPERKQLFAQIQDAVAKDLPTLPLLQGSLVAVARRDVKGVETTLDTSSKFRLGVISK
ncbi:ABC transporter substrate-binding protein [Arthrobacter sp. NPDC090010]|uniref:ABC transporter substrate-binding protein n=1 Tax=Arthrobacter sp. NPDC090010 TaxID=3363942 RepID=UPI0038103A55